MGLSETGNNMVNPKYIQPSPPVNDYHWYHWATPAKSGFRRENNENQVSYTVDDGR